MQSEGGGRDPTPARLPAAEAASLAAAGLAEATWRRVDATLSPIIGPMGMAALFKRSLYLARASQPCLAAVPASDPAADAYAALRAVLSRQTAAAASLAQAVLLQTFHDLLSSLIGASLTERLLRSAAAFPSSGDAAQDPTP